MFLFSQAEKISEEDIHKNTTSKQFSKNKIETSELYFSQFLLDISVKTTEMFRDPEFFAYLRKEVMPLLKTYPKLKIWHAGCSTGQEVYGGHVISDILFEKQDNSYNIFITKNDTLIGWIDVADEIRDEAKLVMNWLKVKNMKNLQI